MKKQTAKKEDKSKKPASRSLGADIVARANARKVEAEKGKKAKVDEKAKEQTQKEERGEKLMLASSQGFALSHAYLDNSVGAMGQLLGDKFKVSINGLSVHGKLTEVEAAKAVATLAEVTERGDVVRGTAMMALGDLVVFVKDSFGENEGDELIQQAVSVLGKGKHSVQESERIARAFPKGERPKGLSWSHLQSLKDGKNSGVTDSKLNKIIETVQEGEVVSTLIIDGKKKEQRKPLSVAATRKLIAEAKGKPEKPSKPKASKPKEVDPDQHVFLYINSEDTDEIYSTVGVDLGVLKADKHIVLDLTDMTVLKPNGSIHMMIKERKVEAQTSEEKPEPEKPKAEKPKKEKKAKVEEDDVPMPD